jgi:hypothetical protein
MREIVSPLSGFPSPFGQRLRALVYVLFILAGDDDSLIDANGDTFKVRE